MSKTSYTLVLVLIAILFISIIKLLVVPNSPMRVKREMPVTANEVKALLPGKDSRNASDNSEVVRQNEITISASEFSFLPSEITVKSGEKIKITLEDNGEFNHDVVFALSNGKYSTKLLTPGESDTIEFIAPEPGSYVYYCSVPGHREAGMEGTLTVVE